MPDNLQVTKWWKLDQPDGAPSKMPLIFLADRQYFAVNALAAAALGYVLLERLWLTQLSPVFARAGELGTVASDICIGYLSAWILVYLVTWRPAYLAKQRAAPVVAKQVFRLFADASQLRGVLRDAANESSAGPLTREELHRICVKVRFRDASNLTALGNPGQHASVLAAIHQYLESSLAAVPRIVELLPYFDDELVLRVAGIQSSDFVALIESLARMEPFVSASLTLEMVEEPMRMHFLECDRLWAWVCERYERAANTVGPSVVEDRVAVPQFALD